MKTKGLFFGLFSGFTWALDTILIGLVLSHTVFLSSDQVIFLAPLVSTFLHDALSSLWMVLYLTIRGELKGLGKKLMTRSGRFVMLGALMGGPVGMTFYVLSVKYIGASYAASISAVYPAIGAFFAFLFLRDKLRLPNWIGLLISITSVIVLGYAGGNEAANYVLGFLAVLVCVVGWGLESVICAYGMKDDEVSPEQALQIRQLVSSLTYGIIILPLFGGHFLTKAVVTSPEVFWIAGVSLAGTASYVYYYKAIYELGPTRAMALNITYSSWAIVLSTLFLQTPLSAKLVVCSLAIIAGALLTATDIRELIGKKEYRRAV